MPSKKPMGIGIIGLALVLAVAAPAFAKNARMVSLGHDAVLNGTHLTEGVYKVEWESHSPELTVTFLQQKNIVATAEGRLVKRDVTYPADAIVYNTNPDGSLTIREIRLGGSKKAIVFGEAASAS